MVLIAGKPFTQETNLNVTDELRVRGELIPGGATYGKLTNAEILALPSPRDLENAFSTDDNVMYTFNGGDWYSPAGGILS